MKPTEKRIPMGRTGLDRRAQIGRFRPEMGGSWNLSSGHRQRLPGSMPNVALVPRGRLIEDLRRAAASGRLADVTPELAFEFAVGVVLQAMQAASERRIAPSQAPGAVAGILRAIGVKPEEATIVAMRVDASDRRIRDESPPTGG